YLHFFSLVYVIHMTMAYSIPNTQWCSDAHFMTCCISSFGACFRNAYNKRKANGKANKVSKPRTGTILKIIDTPIMAYVLAKMIASNRMDCFLPSKIAIVFRKERSFFISRILFVKIIAAINKAKGSASMIISILRA